MKRKPAIALRSNKTVKLLSKGQYTMEKVPRIPTTGVSQLINAPVVVL